MMTEDEQMDMSLISTELEDIRGDIEHLAGEYDKVIRVIKLLEERITEVRRELTDTRTSTDYSCSPDQGDFLGDHDFGKD
jgi:chromosome segregation ATPase